MVKRIAEELDILMDLMVSDAYPYVNDSELWGLYHEAKENGTAEVCSRNCMVFSFIEYSF